MADPPFVQEGRLIDDRHAGVHRADGLGGGGLETGAGGGVDGDRRNAFGSVAGEHVVLMRDPAPHELVDEGIDPFGSRDLAPRRRALEVGEVVARSKADEVARAADQLTVEIAHSRSIDHGWDTPRSWRAGRPW